MKLSIITINYNNAEGLRKTLASVAAQTYADIEHIIIDGGSTDGSVDIIRDYSQSPIANTHEIRWISEPDKGIYNAMNKGIRMATGEYCQFLNSGDWLIDSKVTQRMAIEMERINSNRKDPIGVMYGNMKKIMPNGKILHDACNGGNYVTLNMFYRGCLNHSPAYILRSLFDKYGLYDENLRICSDWKFYLESLVLGNEAVEYVDINVTMFDMTGISETNKELLNNERNQILSELIPQGILKDYELYHFPIEQYNRLKRRHLWGLIYFIERVVFKLEKWHILR